MNIWNLNNANIACIAKNAFMVTRRCSHAGGVMHFCTKRVILVKHVNILARYGTAKGVGGSMNLTGICFLICHLCSMCVISG